MVSMKNCFSLPKIKEHRASVNRKECVHGVLPKRYEYIFITKEGKRVSNMLYGPCTCNMSE